MDGAAAHGLSQVEAVVDRHLSYAEESFLGLAQPSTPTKQALDVDVTSPYYALHLRRLLSGIPLACHETFAHPVGLCHCYQLAQPHTDPGVPRAVPRNQPRGQAATPVG